MQNTLPNNEHIFTFEVDKVEVCKDMIQCITGEELIRKVLRSEAPFEDFSHRDNNDKIYISKSLPGFLNALHTSFQRHYPLRLSVSDFILLIGQGLSRHIENHAEELRSCFVSHEGKEKITISRNEFVKGSQNDWSTVFGDFATEIKKRVKTDVYDVVVDDTSVATKTTRIVSELTLMDCMKSYFDFGVMTLCGIPTISLEGTKEDWQKLKDKVNKLVEMNKDDRLKLSWWLEHLVPVVTEICDTAINKKADSKFWSSIYKYESRSGSEDITGWCTVFFPYSEGKFKNNLGSRKLTTHQVTSQVVDVPFTWEYLGEQIPMMFNGGFMGAQFNKDDYSVKPAHFWSVAYADSKQEKKDTN